MSIEANNRNLSEEPDKKGSLSAPKKSPEGPVERVKKVRQSAFVSVRVSPDSNHEVGLLNGSLLQKGVFGVQEVRDVLPHIHSHEGWRVQHNGEEVHDEDTKRIHTEAAQKARKIAAVIHGGVEHASQLMGELWGKHAIVPFHINHDSGELSHDDLTRRAAEQFNPDGSPKSTIDERRKAHPHTLVPLEWYRKTDPKDFDMSLLFSEEVKKKNLKVLEISSTEFGGGVAKMMHRKMPVMEQLGVNDTWNIQSDDDTTRYDITKGDIHNVLQAVAEEGRGLTPKKLDTLNEWADVDYAKWEEELAETDIVVIHDPQPHGHIRRIREMERRERERGIDKHRFIIYRQHTQPDAEKANTPGTPQNETWNLLYENGLKDADLIIAHPLADSVPANVPPEKVVMMGATTDRFDGLTRETLPEDLENDIADEINEILEYQKVVLKDKDGNELKKVEAEQAPIDWDRGYELEYARWDESKGKDLLLKHYLEYRKNEKAKGTDIKDIKQLILAGNQATDDPSAAKVFINAWEQMQDPEYDDIRDDIKFLMVPRNDFMANVLMRRSSALVINSTREGYEVLAEEALIAGKPVISTKEGGPKLQLEPIAFSDAGEIIDIEGKDSFLIDPRDHKQAGAYMSLLFDPQDTRLFDSMSAAAKKNGKKEKDTTMQNVTNWLYLYSMVSRGEQIPGYFANVHDLAKAEYDKAMQPQQEKQQSPVQKEEPTLVFSAAALSQVSQ
jgi:trehalose synthase